MSLFIPTLTTIFILLFSCRKKQIEYLRKGYVHPVVGPALKEIVDNISFFTGKIFSDNFLHPGKISPYQPDKRETGSGFREYIEPTFTTRSINEPPNIQPALQVRKCRKKHIGRNTFQTVPTVTGGKYES